MPAVAQTQENDDVRPLESPIELRDETEEALAWHGGDARATIATLLADCAHLRRQIDIADRAMGKGFTRGWRPQQERDDGIS